MATLPIQDPIFPQCPVRNLIARVADKWSLLVMHTLIHASQGTMRFSALSQAIPDVSQKVLTQTLRRLEEDGFVERTVYAQVPPRVDYAVTTRARSFMQACQPMVEWAQAHLAEIVEGRRHK
ncbi:MAG: winged helix-turn-helix transcriptional regulator [Muribaculaceae bacterium]